MVVIRDVRNYSSYHFALRDSLLQHLTQFHGSYLRGRCAFTLSLPAPEDLRLADSKFQELKTLYSTLPPLTRPPRPQWRSEK